MALPLGKLTILLGAGLVGSVLAKEGRLPSVSDVFSGAFKMVWKQIGQGDSTPSNVKSRNDLLAQVNSLRQELQSMSNRPVIIIPTNRTGTSRFGIVVVVVVVGYGYVWWKGWKLPDMMFATRRGLSDACTTIAKQLEDVYSSLSTTRRVLSSKIESVDSKIDECASLNASTNGEVSEIQGRTCEMGKSVRFVRETVESLGTKIVRIEGRQNITNEGVRKLCDYALKLENSRNIEYIQASPVSAPRAALERSQLTPSSRTGSLPTSVLSLEPPSPSASDDSHQVQRPAQNAASASDPMESLNILKAVGKSNTLEVSYANRVPEETNGGSSTSGFSSRLFRRTCSVTQGMISRLQS